MTDPRIAELAAKLTPRQKDALQQGWGSVGIARALKAKGLSSGYLGTDNKWVAIVETPLGERVAAYLKEQSSHA